MALPTLASRSTQGCWTCRLRKKKCDENQPACFRCTSLQILCDGYGPRPYWMDRGELQRERARYKTQIIAQIKSAMRKNKPLGTSQVTGLPPPVRPTQGALLQSGRQSGRLGHVPEPERELQHLGRDGPVRNEPLRLDSTDFSAELFYDETVSPSIYDRSSSEAFRATSASLSPTTEGSNVHSYMDVSRPVSQSEASMETIDSLCDAIQSEYPSSESSVASSQADWPLSAQTNPSSAAFTRLTSQAGPGDPILRGDVEDILFMYYLDHVFHIYCPFYLLSNRQARGWLLSILKRVKSAYHAALGLSEMHLATSTHQNGSPARTRAGGHYDLALQELQVSLARSSAWSGNLGLAHNVEVLTTILHLLFYEATKGGQHNWQIHLRGAIALLPLLIQAQAVAKNDHIHEQHHDKIVPPPDTSVSFLLGFFSHVSIIASASTRSNQFLEPDPKLLLETGDIHLPDLTGCSNWAMVLIFEISCLERWKKEEETAHRLSLIELTKRGRQIEERLLERLSTIDGGDPSIGGPVQGNLRPDVIKTEITRIFALSALTYLHVVISGPYPEIPDIKKSVAKTLNAFQNLPDPKLLQYVVWPYCISGCLAAGVKQQDAFRELVTIPHITHGTCLEALNVMEECWRLRETESPICDWVHVMEKRGQYILLI